MKLEEIKHVLEACAPRNLDFAAAAGMRDFDPKVADLAEAIFEHCLSQSTGAGMYLGMRMEQAFANAIEMLTPTKFERNWTAAELNERGGVFRAAYDSVRKDYDATYSGPYMDAWMAGRKQAWLEMPIQVIQDRLNNLAEELQLKYPWLEITFGYIGNCDIIGGARFDDRSWRFWYRKLDGSTGNLSCAFPTKDLHQLLELGLREEAERLAEKPVTQEHISIAKAAAEDASRNPRLNDGGYSARLRVARLRNRFAAQEAARATA